MANFVYHKLFISSFSYRDLDKLLDRIINKSEYCIDFNKIIPMPNELLVNPNSEQAIDNVKKYGYPTWVEWRVGNWGTECNAIESSRHKSLPCTALFRFKTKWTVPEPIIEELGKLAGFGTSFDWYTCEEQLFPFDCYKYSKKKGGSKVHKEQLFHSVNDERFRDYCYDLTAWGWDDIDHRIIQNRKIEKDEGYGWVNDWEENEEETY